MKFNMSSVLAGDFLMVNMTDKSFEKHEGGGHDQSTHGNWATGTDVWSATKGDLDTTFTTKDGSLKVKVANAFMDNPEYKETIKKTLDTVENLQNDFPIKGEIYFQEGDFVTGTNKAWATTMSVSEGGRRSSQMTLTEGLLKPTARKDFLEYTITHEWGHAIDRRDSDRVIQSIEFLARNSDTLPMTKYGYRNGREAFAEAFAVKRLRSHEGGILSEDVPQDPKWERTFNILEVPSAISKATNQNGVSFFVADTFDPDNPPVLIENYTPPVQKHLPGGHDQKDHGSWATGGGMGHLSESTAKEIEDSKALFQEIMGAENDLKETLIGYGYQGDLDYEKLQDRLARRYMGTGMGKNTAILQARIDMGRVAYAMKNAEEKTQYEEIIQKNRASAAAKISEHAEDDGQTADAMERGLAYAKERVLSAMKNGTVTIASSEEVLSAVLEDGRYKNQFETRTSGGKLDVGVRKVGEGLATGTPAGTKLAERPIYGFLTDNETVHTYDSKRATQIATEGTWLDKHEVSRNLDWETTTSINSYKVDQYGEVRFTLKPEVRGRTTLTIGDSLRTGVMADAISNPKPDLVNMGLYKTGAVHHMGGNPTADYLETQIHGGVKVSDIAHIYVPAGRVTAVKAMVEAKGLNIPVSARAGS